jgi:hypothetical protein
VRENDRRNARRKGGRQQDGAGKGPDRTQVDVQCLVDPATHPLDAQGNLGVHHAE